jgi:hypothetical protein
MLGKLMKYEIKATARVFLPVYAALIVSSLTSLLFHHVKFSWPAGISYSIMGGLTVAVIVISFILTLQRFFKNLLGPEGYLMFTLPVGVDHLVLSKLLTSALWFFASGIVVAAAVAIQIVPVTGLERIGRAFAQLQYYLSQNAHYPLFLAEFLVLVVAGFFGSILKLYACISLSLLADRHRVAWSFAAFIGLNTAEQTFSGILFSSADAMFDLKNFFQNLGNITAMHTMLLSMTAFVLFIAVAYYIVTRVMLSRRLNLQ